MNKLFFTVIFCLAGITSSYAQEVVTLTEDLVLTSTLVVSEPTTFQGNGFKIICNDCDPMIRVEGGIDVHFQDVLFQRGYVRWLLHEGGNGGLVTWDSPRMKGKSNWNDPQ